jgi:hypothetical protein
MSVGTGGDASIVLPHMEAEAVPIVPVKWKAHELKRVPDSRCRELLGDELWEHLEDPSPEGRRVTVAQGLDDDFRRTGHRR